MHASHTFSHDEASWTQRLIAAATAIVDAAWAPPAPRVSRKAEMLARAQKRAERGQRRNKRRADLRARSV